MAVSIVNRQRKLRLDAPALRRLVERVLSDHGRPGADVAVVAARDPFVRRLNAAYRGIDEPTDVLSFGAPGRAGRGAAGGAARGPAVGKRRAGAPADEEPEAVLGDIVVSTDRAAAQARARRVPARREVLTLVAHGVLHLLGHGHDTPEDRRRMRTLEKRYVRSAEKGGRTQ